MSRIHIPELRVIWGVRHSEGISLYDTPVLWIYDDEVASFVDPSCGEIIDTTDVDWYRYVYGASYRHEATNDLWVRESPEALAEQVKAELLGIEKAK